MAFVEQFERHQSKGDAQSSRKTTKPLSTEVTVDRLLGLRIIIDEGDTNIFANKAFAAMRGYRLEATSESALENIFALRPKNL